MTNQQLTTELDRLISEAKKVSEIEIVSKLDNKRKYMAMGKVVAYEHIKTLLQ